MSNLQAQPSSVTITTPARLHLGFFDLNGEYGRLFGSLGIALNHLNTKLTAVKGTEFNAVGEESSRAAEVIHQLQQALDLPLSTSASLKIHQAIPAHAGLGSGTQLALAVGMAYSELYQLNLSPSQVAQYTSRGARSGIGVGTFLHGGVIVDGGRGDKTLTPPIIARANFPQDWHIVLIMDKHHQGLNGEHEVSAFNQLAPATSQVADKLCRIVLMQALPALAENDLVSFGLAVKALQEATGDYFSPAQGGRYASKKVAQVLNWLEQQGLTCIGQSSWGPTGFAVVNTKEAACSLVNTLNTQFAHALDLSFIATNAQPHGAVIDKSFD
ncbi:MAG: beta-ribofuranosylaminobenzene 5'-phosphate synthase family protein [Methylophilaceae bacterium]